MSTRADHKQVLGALALLVFSNIYIADAQMINYSRRKSPTDTVLQGQAAKAPEARARQEAGRVSKEIPVRQRSEEVYDKNKDGKLQEDEVNLLLEDAVSSVEMWGQTQVHSDILASFDQDQSGIIDVQEAALIRQAQESGE